MREFTVRRGRRGMLFAWAVAGGWVLAGSGVGGTGGLAWGRVLTFGGLVPGSSQASYAEGGYDFSVTDGSIFVGNSPPLTSGPYVFPSTISAKFHLGSVRPFDLRSIDLSPLNGSVGPQAVTFTGTRAQGGGTVTQTFTTGGAVALQTFNFGPAFTGLTSVAWDPLLTLSDTLVAERGPVMTFGSLVPGSTSAASHAENGFRLDATGIGAIFAGNTAPGVAGAPYVFASHAGTVFRYAAEGGAPFDLFAVDLMPLNATVGAQTVTFTGTIAGGGTVTQSFTTSATLEMRTFVLGPAFANLAAVEWSPGPTILDNIESALTVPEPSAAAAAGLLATVTGLARRRRRDA